MVQNADFPWPGGRINLSKGVRLRVESPQLVFVELVHPGNSPRVHRDVVKGRVGIRYRKIHRDIPGGGALQMLAEDEGRFIDHARSTIFMTEEHEIFDLTG